MKRILLLLVILFSLFPITLYSASRVGTIVDILGKEVTVRNENAKNPFLIKERLYLLTGDKNIILEVTFPMLITSKFRIISGDISKLETGIIVCSVGSEPAPVKKNRNAGTKNKNLYKNMKPEHSQEINNLLLHISSSVFENS